MPDWLWYAAFGFNVGSALAWWLVMTRLARRERTRWQRWSQREDEQILRWAHVDLCSACTAWINAYNAPYNARLAARGLDEDGV